MTNIKVQSYTVQGEEPKAMISAEISLNSMIERQSSQYIMREICSAIAERFVAEHYEEIAAKIDPQAIANISVAEAGVKIREALEKDIPGRIAEKVTREVYQRGIFGGLKRVL